MTHPIKVGNVRLEIRPMPDGRWRCNYKDEAGRWRSLKSKDLDRLKTRVRALAERTHNARRDLVDVPREEYDEFRRWLRTRKRSAPLGDVVAEFLDEQRASVNLSTRHLHGLRGDLEGLRDAVGAGVPIDEVEPASLLAWISEKEVGQRRKFNLRAAAVQLFRWAQEREYLPEGKTAASRLPRFPKPATTIEILAPDELAVVLREVQPHYLGWALLAGFAGVRSEELRPDARSGKRPVHWQDIKADWIDLPPETAKQTRGRTGRRRLIPVQPVLRRWLDRLSPPSSGPVVTAGRPTIRETARLGAFLDNGWPKNGLRHSYGTYRCAATQNVPMVAREMGNTPAVIQSHYDRVVTPDVAERWFSVGLV